MAKAKLVFFSIFLVLSIVYLSGCAAGLALVGGEAAGAVVYGGQKMTGADLREFANWSTAYEKKVDMKIRLKRNVWTCARGKGVYTGQEYCMPPKLAKGFKNSEWFTCMSGRGGGVITKVATGDSATYCEGYKEEG